MWEPPWGTDKQWCLDVGSGGANCKWFTGSWVGKAHQCISSCRHWSLFPCDICLSFEMLETTPFSVLIKKDELVVRYTPSLFGDFCAVCSVRLYLQGTVISWKHSFWHQQIRYKDRCLGWCSSTRALPAPWQWGIAGGLCAWGVNCELKVLAEKHRTVLLHICESY